MDASTERDAAAIARAASPSPTVAGLRGSTAVDASAQAEAGDIVLRADAPGLASATLTIPVSTSLLEHSPRAVASKAV